MSYVFKVIVVGDGGVGKTALTLRCTTKVFVENYKVTIGVDFRIKRYTMDNIQTSLLIWDTGGQERFTKIRSHYFQGASGALIVYDVTNERSFLNIKKWHREVKTHLEDIPMILIGNKSDLEQLRMISFKDGEKLAKEIGCPFFEASAKAGENVELIFGTLNSLLLERAQRKKARIAESKAKYSLMIDRNISEKVKSKNTAVSKKKAT
ncbi:MAG: GTP-binding protein [Promethearchaeota archaeon]